VISLLRCWTEVDLAADLPQSDPTLDVKDVKVDGDVAAVANETESPGGIALYDVSDPTNPEFRSFYAPEPPSDIHNCHLADGYAYLSLGEPENTDTDGDGQRDLVRIFADAGVEIVDVSDPAGPEHAATWLLKEELPNYAKAGVNPCHDLYTQDGLCYAAFWDAGTVALDVSDPADPTFVSQFGAAPNGDTVIRPWNVNDETFDEYLDEVFPLGRYLGPPGTPTASSRPPTATTSTSAPRRSSAARAGSTSGTSPTSRPRRRWAASTRRTSMPSGRPTNFDITTNRLHASWYAGGVRVYDVTDPSDPAERAHYDPDGYAFWTAERGRGYTVGGVYGDRSATEGGIVVLSDDRGPSGRRPSTARTPLINRARCPRTGPDVAGGAGGLAVTTS
jgi:hypothetical protein